MPRLRKVGYGSVREYQGLVLRKLFKDCVAIMTDTLIDKIRAVSACLPLSNLSADDTSRYISVSDVAIIIKEHARGDASTSKKEHPKEYDQYVPTHAELAEKTDTLNEKSRWYIVCNEDCSYEGDERNDLRVWTLSRTPEKEGWCTDSGQPGYGLTKAEAKELANAANNSSSEISLNNCVHGNKLGTGCNDCKEAIKGMPEFTPEEKKFTKAHQMAYELLKLRYAETDPANARIVADKIILTYCESTKREQGEISGLSQHAQICKAYFLLKECEGESMLEDKPRVDAAYKVLKKVVHDNDWGKSLEKTPKRETEYHVERDTDGYETLILHAVGKSDEAEKWIRYDIYEELKKREQGEISLHEREIAFTCERTQRRWKFKSLTKLIEAFLDATQPKREQGEIPVIEPDYEAALADTEACAAEDAEVNRIINMTEEELIAEAGGREQYEKLAAEREFAVTVAMARFNVANILRGNNVSNHDLHELSKRIVNAIKPWLKSPKREMVEYPDITPKRGCHSVTCDLQSDLLAGCSCGHWKDEQGRALRWKGVLRDKTEIEDEKSDAKGS